MALPKLVVLVRHGQAQVNVMHEGEIADSPIASHLSPLTVKGRRQAEITGEYVRENFGSFDLHFTSYFPRARETFKIIFPDVEPVEDAMLGEVMMGLRNVFSEEDFARRYPEELRRKEKEGLYQYLPLGGEGGLSGEIRVRVFFQDLLRECAKESRVLIVGHGTWMTLFRKYIEGWTVEEFNKRWKFGHPKNAALLVYERRLNNGKQRLVLIESRIPWEGKLS